MFNPAFAIKRQIKRSIHILILAAFASAILAIGCSKDTGTLPAGSSTQDASEQPAGGSNSK